VYAIPVGLLALAGLGVAAGTDLQNVRHGVPLVTALLAVGSVLPVVLVFRWPRQAWRVAFVMGFAGAVGARDTESFPWNPVQIIGFLVVLFVVALTQRTAVTAWALGLSLVPVFVFGHGANAYGPAVFLLIVSLVGDTVGRARQNRRVIAEQEELTELERARRAVLEERARIAREMHDVVAHHMSMIAVQAETAPYRMPELTGPTRAEMAGIAAAARSALTDMRRLLGALRQEDDETLRAPQPGLGDVPALVETARRAGVPVTLALPAAPVPEAVGLAAYRIVQEALANAARHAPGSRVEIAGRVRDERLELAVRNGPAVPGIPVAGPAGGRAHGLMGMRERATLLGGTLTAGPDRHGGFTVTAVLPWGGAT